MSDIEQLEQRASVLLREILDETSDDAGQQKKAELGEILAKLPDDKYHYERGVLALLDDNTDAAAEHFSRVVECDETRWNAAAELGDIHIQRQDFDKAAYYYELALAHAPQRSKADPYYGLARCQLGLENPDAAIGFMKKSLECDPDYSSASSGLASIYFERGDATTALQCYERALLSATDEDKSLLYEGVGFCKRELGDLDGAIECWVGVLEADQRAWWIAVGLAGIYWERKNWKAARAYWEQAIERISREETISPHDKAAIYFDLACSCSRLKDYKSEQSAYQACLELDPDFKYARNNLGWSLVRSGDFEQAVDVFRESMERGKDGKYPRRGLAKALRKLGRFAEAIGLCKQDIHKGKLTKYAQREISELEALMEKQEKGEPVPEEEEDVEVEAERGAAAGEAIDDEEEELAVEERIEKKEGQKPDTPRRKEKQVVDREKRKRKPSTRISREDVLEALLERRIDRGQEVFNRRLRMFQSEDSKYGRYGRQFAIAGVGIIDLLTVDLDTNELIVIELKRNKPDRDIIGQLYDYVVWVRSNLAVQEQTVRGIICVWEATDRLRNTSRGLPDIDVFEYDLTFTVV
jgi:tetratricopeptide (TPR) repeat protein